MPNLPDGSDYQTDHSGYDSGVNQSLGLSDTDQKVTKVVKPKLNIPEVNVPKLATPKTPELRLPLSDEEKEDPFFKNLVRERRKSFEANPAVQICPDPDTPVPQPPIRERLKNSTAVRKNRSRSMPPGRRFITVDDPEPQNFIHVFTCEVSIKHLPRSSRPATNRKVINSPPQETTINPRLESHEKNEPDSPPRQRDNNYF